MARRSDLLGVTGAETIIGAGAKVKGDLVGEGDIVIDGLLDGQIKTAGDLMIGVNARIKAEVSGRNVSVAGQLTGDIKAEGQTAIAETGRVRGNITTHTLDIRGGAAFSGNCVMTQTTLPHQTSTPEPEDKRTEDRG